MSRRRARRFAPGRSAARSGDRARARGGRRSRSSTGTIIGRAAGGQALRIPWAIVFRADTGDLLGSAALTPTSFSPSDTTPAVLSVRAGRVVRDGGLADRAGRAASTSSSTRGAGRSSACSPRCATCFPARYSFGITGRGPTGSVLAPGGYEIRLVAWPTLPLDAKPQRAQVSFRSE